MNMPEMNTFVDRLFDWYAENRRQLPWRCDPSPYEVWVSEVMLQQTTVPAVAGRFEQWMEHFPTLEAVAGASEREILAEWEGLGYYQRATRIHAAAQRIVENHDGRIPRDRKALLDLPGVGPYIGAAIRSLAFGADEVAVDANLCRVFMRLRAIRGRATKTAVRKKVQNLAAEILPAGESSRFNQALMDFGSLVCRPSGPDCGHCFATDLCLGYRKGLQEDIPERRRKDVEKIDTAVAIFRNVSRIYIQKRPSDGLFGGMWEFPGGKVEAGETAGEAVRREVREELAVNCQVRDKLTSFVHYYTRFRVTLHAFMCVTDEELPEDCKHRWVELARIEEFPMPSANRQIIDRLRSAH